MTKKSDAVAREDRRRKVAANLLAGFTYREMAHQLEVSPATIKKDVDIIVGRIQKEQVRDGERWIVLQMARLDRALTAIWGKVMQGDVQAVDRLQRLIDQQAKYLGYDKPIRLDWQVEIVTLMMSGKITTADVEEELGHDAARELFESIGLTVGETGEIET